MMGSLNLTLALQGSKKPWASQGNCEVRWGNSQDGVVGPGEPQGAINCHQKWQQAGS